MVARLSQHRLAIKIGLVFLLGVAVSPQIISHVRDSNPLVPLYVVFSVLLIVPLAFRDTFPLPVFGLVVMIAGAQLACGIALSADVSVLIALYSVATTFPLRTALIAAGIVEVGVCIAAWHLPHPFQFGDAMVVLTAFVVAATMTGAYVGGRRRAIAELVGRNDQLRRDRDNEVRLAAAEERNRIARDMHDIIAHSLAVMVTLADAAGRKVRTQPDRAEVALAQLAQTGRAALNESRQLVGTLHSDGHTPRRPQPSVRDLKELVEAINTAGCPALLVSSGDIESVPPDAGVAVYRIVQESLTNILKHGRDVKNVRVTVKATPFDVRVVVHDDGGTRVDSQAGSLGRGVGLAGMRERAHSVGGTIAAGPDAPGGWTVSSIIPYPASSLTGIQRE